MTMCEEVIEAAKTIKDACKIITDICEKSKDYGGCGGCPAFSKSDTKCMFTKSIPLYYEPEKWDRVYRIGY